MLERGGTSEERLFLYDKVVTIKGEFGENEEYLIRKTDMPDIDKIIQRHKARYMLPAFFVRSGMKILDFPCGSGYGSQILSGGGVEYEGRDYDRATIEYCRNYYAGTFVVDDLSNPDLCRMKYDLIACIEGLEHIEQKYQQSLIKAFYEVLKPNGILVISTPEKNEQNINPYHKCELTKKGFEELLRYQFKDVQIIEHEDILHNGIKSNMLYGICRKGD